jgi:hypothetical protein
MVESTSEADYYAGNKWERESTLAFDKDVLDAHDVDSPLARTARPGFARRRGPARTGETDRHARRRDRRMGASRIPEPA